MKFQHFSLIVATSTLIQFSQAATLRTRPGTRDGAAPVPLRRLQSGKGGISSGKGALSSGKGAVLSGKGAVSSGKGETATSQSSDDRSGAVISRSTGSGGKGLSGKGSGTSKGGTTSSGNGALGLREDNTDTESSGKERDDNSRDAPVRSGNGNAVDLGFDEPADLTVNKIGDVGGKRNFGSLSNDDP